MSQSYFFNPPPQSLFPFVSSFISSIWLFLLIGFVLWLWLVLDCAKRDFINRYEKAAWIIVLIAFPVPAIIAYLIAVKTINPRGIMTQ